MKQECHAKVKQHVAKQGRRCDPGSASFDIDVARSNVHHKDADLERQRDKELGIHNGGKEGSKDFGFGLDRRSFAGEGLDNASGDIDKGDFGGFSSIYSIFYRRSGTFLGGGDKARGEGGYGKGGYSGYGKGCDYDKDHKRHKPICKHLNKSKKNTEAVHIDSAAEFDAVAAQNAAQKARAENKAEAKQKLRKGHDKGGDL
ncbi:hypothetical protein OC835_007962 [Tilletia horrida]|nr:hypothetical protein OC835_007962 [Tilletia horrida]